jgi:clathrin heavy chain
MQLYSIERGSSQILQGRVGAFSWISISGSEPVQVLYYVEKRNNAQARLQALVLRSGENDLDGDLQFKPRNLPVPAGAIEDDPVVMTVCREHGLISIMTQMGYLHLFEIFSGRPLGYARMVSEGRVFAACEQHLAGGILAIASGTGQVFRVALDEDRLLPYLTDTLRDQELALQVSLSLSLVLTCTSLLF